MNLNALSANDFVALVNILGGERARYIADCVIGNEEKRIALQELWTAYIANEGTSGEFVSCITPQGIPAYWELARKALGK